eukprot:scaffold784_cov399-Prasinococcus_capsulatus_cf.AAC.5
MDSLWRIGGALDVLKCLIRLQARKYYDASLAANDKHAAAWHGWAVLELREGNSRRAMELLKKGIKRRPRAYLLQLELAQLFAKLGDATSARYHFARYDIRWQIGWLQVMESSSRTSRSGRS